MNIPDIDPDDFLDEIYPIEEEQLVSHASSEVNDILPDPSPSINNTLKKYSEEDTEHASRDEDDIDLRICHERLHGRDKKSAELINRRIDPEVIRFKMRYVPKILRNTELGQMTICYINVEQLAYKIYDRFAVNRYHREGRVFLDDIIQQMALILLTAEEGHTKSWYQQLAYVGVKNFLYSGAFNSENKYFASRKGWSKNDHYHRIIFTDNADMLENRFCNAASSEDTDYEDGNNLKTSFEFPFVHDSAGCQRRSSPVLVNWGSPFAFQNRGYWLNCFSRGVQHYKYVTMKIMNQISEEEIEFISEILRGNDIEAIVMDCRNSYDVEEISLEIHIMEDRVKNLIRRFDTIKLTCQPEKVTITAIQQFIVRFIRLDVSFGQICQIEDTSLRVLQSIIRRYNDNQDTDCSDLHMLRPALRRAIQLATRTSHYRSWKNLEQEFILKEADVGSFVYEEYIRVLFQHAATVLPIEVLPSRSSSGLNDQSGGVTKQKSVLSDPVRLCPICWPVRAVTADRRCSRCDYPQKQKTTDSVACNDERHN